MKKEVVIIGSGFAGLAAGVALVSEGHHVTIIEARGHLGGRAYSYREPILGTTLDNGQHILMGCYRETLAFLEKIGTLDRLDFQKNLTVDYAGRGTGVKRFKAWPLPNPLHLLMGFLFFRGLSWKDKSNLRFLAQRLKEMKREGEGAFQKLDRMSVSHWLHSLRQTPEAREKFWDILNFAALNDAPDRSSAALFAKVLDEALFSGKDGARIAVPKVGLSDLYTEAARDYIERKGGHFLMKTRVAKVHFDLNEATEIELEGGRRLAVEQLVSTVPWMALKKILPETILYKDPFFKPLHELSASPIVSIHLWFDRPIIDRPFVGLWGTRTHWVFDKSNLGSSQGKYYHVSLVISGGREEMKMPGPDLSKMALQELSEVFPTVSQAQLLHSMVSKEPEATLGPAPGVESLRLPQKTPYRNFYLAGDWTATGLPATIESAVRSGHRAAELLKE